jgi:hypothetical protein
MNSLPDGGGQELQTASRKLLGILLSADQEYDESLPPQHKQAIWAVLAGALRVLASTQDQRGYASLELHKALVSLSRGDQGDTADAQALAPREPRQAQRSAQQDFDAARCLAAFEYFPKRRQDIDDWSRQHLGRNLKQLLKQRDNLKQGRVKSPGFRSALNFMRAALAAGDDRLFEDILSSSKEG